MCCLTRLTDTVMILEFADREEEAEKAPDDCLMPHKGGVSVREVGARRRKLHPPCGI